MATRRSNGEGITPIKPADGRWQIRIRTSQTSIGAETRKTLYGRTRAEVVAKAAPTRATSNAGPTPPPQPANSYKPSNPKTSNTSTSACEMPA